MHSRWARFGDQVLAPAEAQPEEVIAHEF